VAAITKFARRREQRAEIAVGAFDERDGVSGAPASARPSTSRRGGRESGSDAAGIAEAILRPL
jgi:hypothetical protein